ncbi:hypothetical protein [Sphingobacterium sp.]|uniref:hypothetical protein n=1 Tax=Sphingobacterium sp. TaxID=341027 RepID=UPI002899905D|nr:hypothetical protein [Sphingobacterium sp.]
MGTLSINKENAIKAFEQANDKGKKLLKNLFGPAVFVKNIMEIIVDLPSALAFNGKTQEQFDWETERDTDAQRADKELEEIATALREFKPLSMSERWYCPYFERQNTGSFSSFSFCAYNCDIDYAGVCARHCVDTSEKAIYMGKQFIKIYNRKLGPSR